MAKRERLDTEDPVNVGADRRSTGLSRSRLLRFSQAAPKKRLLTASVFTVARCGVGSSTGASHFDQSPRPVTSTSHLDQSPRPVTSTSHFDQSPRPVTPRPVTTSTSHTSTSHTSTSPPRPGVTSVSDWALELPHTKYCETLRFAASIARLRFAAPRRWLRIVAISPRGPALEGTS
jgi:hypothetical protein